MGPLDGRLRVVEIGDLGEVCGKILADAGADVIRVESPQGARSRHTGPFIGDQPSVDGSLRHAYWNSNKRGVTLNLDDPEAIAIWTRLVESADVVIDACGPGVLEAGGAGYARFEAREGLIWCSVTPFGLDGPWRDWHRSDLVHLALGGPMMSTGYDDHDLPPIRPDGEHSLAVAGEYAAIAILAALLEREQSGRGQHIDLSMHESVACTVEGAFPNWEYLGQLVQRQTGRHAASTPTQPWQYQTADGRYVILMGGGVPRDTRVWDALMEWMREHDAMEDLDDPKYREAIFHGPARASAERVHVQEVVGRFVQRLPAEEVYRRGQACHLPWGIIRRPEENLDDPHWTDRGFFWDGAVPGVDGPVRFPGVPYSFSETPLGWRRRAPLLGEHNHEVFAKELEVPAESLPELARRGVL